MNKEMTWELQHKVWDDVKVSADTDDYTIEFVGTIGLTRGRLPEALEIELPDGRRARYSFEKELS